MLDLYALAKKATSRLDKGPRRATLKALANIYCWLSRSHSRVDFDGDFWSRQCRETLITMVENRNFWYSPATLRRTPRLVRESLAATTDYWFHEYCPTPGDTIVDVGAGATLDIVTFSRSVGPTGHVIAIEAHPDTYAQMKRTVARNHLANVTCIHVAAMDQKGRVQISDLDVAIANRVTITRDVDSNVPADSLDNVLGRIPDISSINYLKMNIEGAERYALPGAVETLSRTQFATIAAHSFLATDTQASDCDTRDLVIQQMQQMGFAIRLRADDPRPWVRDHIHCSRT